MSNFKQLKVRNRGMFPAEKYLLQMMIRTYLKKKIFASDQGEVKHQPAGILAYFEDLMRGFNADMGQKDFFEIGYRNLTKAYLNLYWFALVNNCYLR